MLRLLLVFLACIGLGQAQLVVSSNQEINGWLIQNNKEEPALVIGDPSENPIQVENIVVRGFIIHGNKLGSEYSAMRPWLRNNGITIRRARNVLVENCIIIGNRSGGIVLEKGCENVLIRNCILEDNYFDGLAAYETRNSKFENLIIRNNKCAAISLDWWVRDCEFRGIVASGHEWVIFARAVWNLKFSNLLMFDNQGFTFFASNLDCPRDQEVRDIVIN